MAYPKDTYARRSASALPPRDVEAAALEFANRGLRSAEADGTRIASLSRNRKLWSMLLTELGMTGNGLPPILKQDLVTIATWSIGYSIRAMLEPLPLEALMEVNQNIIDGLRRPADVPIPIPAAIATASRRLASVSA